MGKNLAVIARYFKSNPGFSIVTNSVKYIKAEDGHCLAEYVVQREHANIVGSLHGGFSATLVDVVTSFALFFGKKDNGLNVSTDMHLTYLNSAKVGDKLTIEANILKCGKSMAYLNCEIRKKETGDLVVRGTHTALLISTQYKDPVS